MDAEPDDRDELAADAPEAFAKLGTGDRSATVLDTLEAWAKAYAAGECKAPTPYQLRLKMRNVYIRRAGAAIDARTSWARAGELAKRVRTFELSRWPLWQALSLPPAHADAVDQLLWHARRLDDDEFPQSRGGLFRLL